MAEEREDDRKSQPNPQIATAENFTNLDIRVGRILSVEDFAEARKPLYKITVDFGKLGIRKTGAGLKNFYTEEELIGRPVVAIINFPPKQISNLKSECLILAAITNTNDTVLLKPDRDVDPGAKIF